jgi:uncharacterized protein (TIGR01370 family)
MNRMHKLILPVCFLFCLALASCAAPASPVPAPTQGPTQAPARQRIKSIQSYVVYYGSGRVDDLARYDLAIVQPETLTAEELADLHSRGTLVVAYLSVGEVEPDRPWYSDGRFDPSWALGKNENWGSYFIDAGQSGWRSLMVDLTGEYMQKGFDGIFMDTVDTASSFPETRDGMIQLITLLRAAYPQALLVQNRGFSVISAVSYLLDAVMFEDLSTSYDFADQEYTLSSDEATAQEMVLLHDRTGLPILALDYAPPDNPGRAFRAVQIARGYGFVPSVSVINLDDIPDYKLDSGLPADLRVKSIASRGSPGAVSLLVTVENIGLSATAPVTLTVTTDGDLAAAENHTFGPGDVFQWTLPWPDAPDKARVEALIDYQDATPADNRLAWEFSVNGMEVEPVLPPEQQRRRPASNGPDIQASFAASPPVIDGSLADWPGFPCLKVDQNEQVSFGNPEDWQGPQDLSGEACYAWDSANLYVALRMHDDAIVQQFTGDALWKGDHVELWFDTQLQLDFDEEVPSDDDFQLGLSPGDFAKIPPDIYIWQPSLPQEAYQDLVEYAAVRTEDGYTAELKIPASTLNGLRLVENQAVGASFEPSDTDTPGGTEQEMMMSYAPQSSSQWGNPTLWNNLLLTAQP